MAEAVGRGGDRGRYRAPGSSRSSASGRNEDRRGKDRGARGRVTPGGAVRAENDRNWRRRDPQYDRDRDRDRDRPVSAPVKSDSAALLLQTVVGECMNMCAVEEVRARHQIKDMSRFETPPLSSSDPTSWAVKKYRRPAAGRIEIDALELRPPHVLTDTLAHLFTNVLPWHGCGFDWAITTLSPNPPSPNVHDFLGLYHFLSDRLRAVRQDFVIQRVRDHSRVVALVQVARFHILASFRAAQVIGNASDKALDWSETLNDQQLASALTEVHALYPSASAVATEADTDTDKTRLFTEAIAYDVLLHLRDPRAVSLLLLKVPPQLRRCDSLHCVLALFVACHTNDSVCFVRSFRNLPVVQQCLALRHLPMVWITTILRMNKAYGKMDRFGFSEIAEWVGLPKADDARLLCTAMNVHTEDETPVAAAESWEVSHENRTGYATFKLNPIRDELETEDKRELLRRKAVSIQKDLVQRCTATALIIGS